MSYSKLIPGDRVSFKQNGRNLRAVVIESCFKGNSFKIPVCRFRNLRIPCCNADGNKTVKVRWFDRKELRKLPASQ